MKKMKEAALLVLALVLVFTLAGCSNQDDDEVDETIQQYQLVCQEMLEGITDEDLLSDYDALAADGDATAEDYQFFEQKINAYCLTLEVNNYIIEYRVDELSLTSMNAALDELEAVVNSEEQSLDAIEAALENVENEFAELQAQVEEDGSAE